MTTPSLNRARAVSRLLLASALALLAACTKPAQDSTTDAKHAVGAGIAGGRAVVADVSVGTNPYHAFFRRPDWTKQPCKSDPAIPCDLPALNLTLGDDYAASLAADSATWAAYKPGTLYWVPGTNLLLLTLHSITADVCGTPCGIHDGYVDAGYDHGVETSGAMAGACPDCYVLVIQDAPNYDGGAVDYIAKQLPWVDFVSQTGVQGYGPNPFSVFDNTLLDKNGVMPSFQQATRDLADSGRLFFAASGDYAAGGTLVPDAVPALGYSYPAWVVAAGGMTAKNPFPDAIEKVCDAIDVMSGTPAEMLGDFIQYVPRAGAVKGYAVSAGTSFSAPQLAGRFAEALATVRAQLGDGRAPGALWAGTPTDVGALSDGLLTAGEMRAAFDATARYFAPTDFNPACEAEIVQHEIDSAFPLPQRPASVTPWLDMGWGYVGADEAALAARVILGDVSAPDKPAEATAWMSEFMSAREAAFPGPQLP